RSSGRGRGLSGWRRGWEPDPGGDTAWAGESPCARHGLPRGRSRRSPRSALLVALAGEDHATRRGLVDRGHRHVHRPTDEPLAVLHHHHGAVVQVGHALVGLLAFLYDVHVKRLAG